LRIENPPGTMTASYGAKVCGAGYKDWIVLWDVSDPACERVITGSYYDGGLYRLAVSHDGGMVAVAGFYAGVEAIAWREGRLLWRRGDIRMVQRVSFGNFSSDVCVETDDGRWIWLEADSGRTVREWNGVSEIFVDESGIVGVLRRRDRYDIFEIGSRRIITTAAPKSFAMVWACITKKYVVIHEANGAFYSIRLADGVEFCYRNDASICFGFGAIEERDSIVIWRSSDDEYGGHDFGSLCIVDLESHMIYDIASKSWQLAVPCNRGRTWVFSDRSSFDIEDEMLGEGIAGLQPS